MLNKLKLPKSCLLLGVLLVVWPIDRTHAQNTWLIPGTGFWYTNANWSDGIAPGLFDIALINNGGTAVTDGPLSVSQRLTLGQNPGDSGYVEVTSFGPFTGELIPGALDIGLGGTGGATVTLGSQLGASTTVLGGDATGVGKLTVKDANSVFSAPSFTIGKAGQGSVLIENGGRVWTYETTLGSLPGSSGTVTMSGLTSHWDTEGPLVIGNAGSAEVNWTGGSLIVEKTTGLAVPVPQLLTIGTQGALRMGTGSNFFGNLTASEVRNHGTLQFNYPNTRSYDLPVSGNGQIVHDGGGSTILTDTAGFTGSITVNAGLLRLDDTSVNLAGNSIRTGSGAFMDYDGATVSHAVLRGTGIHYVVPGAASKFNSITTQSSSVIFQDGIAEYDNATLRGNLLSNNVTSFDGVWNASSGVIDINSDLNTQDFSTDGVLNIHNGGTLNNSISNLTAGGGSRTTIETGGTLNIFGATSMELNGALLVNNGTVTGTVNVNYGSLAKGTGSYDIVNVNQGGVYAPGTSPGITSAQAVNFDTFNYNTGKPVLQIELGGTTAGSQYDRLVVAGQLTLGGTLDVVLIDQPGGGGLFAPGAGQNFDILDWGSITGTFNNLLLPTLAGGLTWDTSQLYTLGILGVTGAALTGDLNGDGFVGIADLNIVLGNWNQNVTPGDLLLGDPSGDGFVGIQDLNTVLGNWNAGTPPMRQSLTAIPEPSAMICCLVLLLTGASGRAKNKWQ